MGNQSCTTVDLTGWGGVSCFLACSPPLLGDAQSYNVHATSALWIWACSKHVLQYKRDKSYHWRKAWHVCRGRENQWTFQQSNNMLWLWALVRQIKYHVDFLIGTAKEQSPTGPSRGWWEHVIGGRQQGNKWFLVLGYLSCLEENKYISYIYIHL